MNILILGPQGSGKGTQAKLLSESLRLFYFEAGVFLRGLAKSDKRIDAIVNKKGDMVPDEEMFNYVVDNLETKILGSGVLFDGYPRSIKQYELLKKWLKAKSQTIDIVFFLDVSDKESIKRLSARRICENCENVCNLITNPPSKDGVCDRCGGALVHREDDKPEAIKERLMLYRKFTQPLLAIFKKEGILNKIDGERPIDAIQDDLFKTVRRVR